MSAKKTKKSKGNKNLKWAIVISAAVFVAAVVLLVVLGLMDGSGDVDDPVTSTTTASSDSEAPGTSGTEIEPPQATTVPEPVVESVTDIEQNLNGGLKIKYAGSYTGVYMEDGSDEVVARVLMLVVENCGDKDIQYANITLPTEAGEAVFSLSTLPVGESVVLLEQNRMTYTGNEDISKAVAGNIAVFSEPLSLFEDKLKLQILDGAINVSNVSGEDITGDVVIYYKNASSDLYYGGITYRVRIEGGIKTDEIKQIMARHFSPKGSKVVFVTVG